MISWFRSAFFYVRMCYPTVRGPFTANTGGGMDGVGYLAPKPGHHTHLGECPLPH